MVMPEQMQDDVAVPNPAYGSRTGPIVVVVVVLVLIVAAFAAVLAVGGGARNRYKAAEGGQLQPKESLDIPVLEVGDISLSVPLDTSGSRRKALNVGVVVRFEPPEGQQPNPRLLQKEFVPRVINLRAEFRHIIIEEMSTKDYTKLSDAEVRTRLLKTFKARFDDELKEYGLKEYAQVEKVLWADFFWN
jgi:hypothetical protein